MSDFSAPCQKTDFSVGILEFDERSHIHIKEKKKNGVNVSTDSDKEIGNDIDYFKIRLYYSTMDVKVSTTVNLIDVPTFVGSIGGNLGLFLGFSFLGSLQVIADNLKKSIHSRLKFWNIM